MSSTLLNFGIALIVLLTTATAIPTPNIGFVRRSDINKRGMEPFGDCPVWNSPCVDGFDVDNFGCNTPCSQTACNGVNSFGCNIPCSQNACNGVANQCNQDFHQSDHHQSSEEDDSSVDCDTENSHNHNAAATSCFQKRDMTRRGEQFSCGSDLDGFGSCLRPCFGASESNSQFNSGCEDFHQTHHDVSSCEDDSSTDFDQGNVNQATNCANSAFHKRCHIKALAKRINCDGFGCAFEPCCAASSCNDESNLCNEDFHQKSSHKQSDECDDCTDFTKNNVANCNGEACSSFN